MRKFFRPIFLISLILLISCSKNPVPEPILPGTPGTLAAAHPDEIVIQAGDEISIRVQGIEGKAGERGDKGDRGDEGPQGPQGQPGTGSGSADYISIIDYGADSTGENDSSDAIEEAVDAAKKGQTVYFPHGKFKITRTIRIAKGVNLRGSGTDTHIFQTADATLFHLAFNTTSSIGFAGKWIENMCLSSAATSEGTSLLFFDGTPYNVVENVAFAGAYTFIHLKGALGMKFYNLMNTYYPHVPVKHRVPEYIALCEKAYGRAINHTIFRDCHFQQQLKNGIVVKSQSPEGGIEIAGNLFEGFSGTAISLNGVNLAFAIHDIHFEANKCDIELRGCSSGNIYGGMARSKTGIFMRSCHGIHIHDGYFDIDADESNRHVTIENIKYYKNNLKSRLTKCIDCRWVGNTFVGACGQYTGDTPLSEYNGSFDEWSGAAPSGFKALGSIDKETAIVLSGNAVKVKRGNVCGLRLDLPARKVAGLPVTVSVWVYKLPGGFNPRLAIVYDNWSSCTLGSVEDVPEQVWTRVKATFYIPKKISNAFLVIGGYYPPDGNETIFDEANVSFTQY